MKNLIFVAVQILSLTCFSAGREIVIVGSDNWFSGGNVTGYITKDYETDLSKKSGSQCHKNFGTKVKKIRNINFQINGDFKIAKSNTNELEAITYPVVVYTAVVECDEAL